MAVQKETLLAIMIRKKDKRREEALKYAQQINMVRKTIIAILYNGTEVDLDDLKAKIKSYASPQAAMEELLEHGLIKMNILVTKVKT
jgi:hypothetical protein